MESVNLQWLLWMNFLLNCFLKRCPDRFLFFWGSWRENYTSFLHLKKGVLCHDYGSLCVKILLEIVSASANYFSIREENYRVLYSERIYLCLFKMEFLTGQIPLGFTFLFLLNISNLKDANVNMVKNIHWGFSKTSIQSGELKAKGLALFKLVHVALEFWEFGGWLL